MADEADVKALIAKLYDAALDESLWHDLGAVIARAFDGHSAILKILTDQAVEVVTQTDNFLIENRDPGWARDWHLRDLWAERARLIGPGTVITDQDLTDQEDLRNSAFYREWLRPLTIAHVVGVVVPLEDGSLAVLGAHRAEGRAPFLERDKTLFGHLVPHVRRVLQIRQDLRTANLARALSLATLDALDTALVVVDRNLRLVCATSHARTLLERSAALSIERGKLTARSAELSARLRRAVGNGIAADTTESLGADGLLAVPRHGLLPLTLTIAPLRPQRFGLPATEPLAMILLRDGERLGLDTDHLRVLFGFTPTEAAIAADLGLGRSPEMIARSRQIGLETVRSHVKRILQKSGTRRQAEAAALFARTAGLKELD